MRTLEQTSQLRTWAKAWAAFAVTLIIAATLNCTELSADGTSNCQGSGGQGQISQYCDSAQSSTQGTDVDSALYKVWGGVATICTAACVSSSPPGTSATACKYSDRAGAGTDALATKNYASALTGIATGQVTSQASKAMGGGQQSANNGSNGTQGQNSQNGQTGQKPQSRMTSCMNAATSTMQAVSKYKSAKSSSQAAAANTTAANQLASKDTATGNDPNEKASGATAGGLGSEPGRGLAEGQSGATASSASICATASATGSAAATIQCAVANDPTLPSYVATPQFLNDFKKASGTDFSNFGSDPEQDPTTAIGQAASGGLDGNTATQVAVAMRSLGSNSPQAPSEVAAYTPSGGGAPAAAAPSSDDGDMVKVAQALMEQMQAGQKGDQQAAAPSGIQAVAVANQTRSPASVLEDKTLSIFDRVTYRYLYTTKVLGMENSK
jgi:hypothetical protein